MPSNNNEQDLFKYIEAHAYAGVFSDILDEMGYRDCVISPDTKIRPLDEGYAIFGRCCTMLNEIDTNPIDPYEGAIRCIDNIEEGAVLFTTGKGNLSTGIMGELTATAMRSRGAKGAIVNGYSRDIRKLKLMGFPTFTWGPSPIDTTGRVRVTAINEPIEVGGVVVHPRELVFADYDGIVIIPSEVEDEVIEKVIERIKVEGDARSELSNGQSMRSVWEKYQVL